MARIDLVDVCKTLREPAGRDRGATFKIEDLSLRVPDGTTMVVLGPSGCGKTTLLKIIAGLIPPDSGHVRYDDVDVRDVPPGDRRVGMVFQNYALDPHFTSRTCWIASRGRSPAERSSASRWRAVSPGTPRCSWWTSRSPTWTRRCARNIA